MKRVFWVTVLVLALWLMVAGVAWAADGDNQDGVTTGEVALLLAPLVAAATAIERFIEMGFNQVESVILNLGNALGAGSEYVKWAQGQVKDVQKLFLALGEDVRKAQTALNQALKRVEEAPAGAARDHAMAELQKAEKEAADRMSAFDKAEDALEDAQERLVQFLKSPYWVSRKQAIATLAAIVLGLVAAFTGRIRMFALLNIDLAAGVTDAGVAQFLMGVDMAITGLVIGTGSGPVHSLIGLLQNTKDAVDEAGKLWKGTAAVRVFAGEAAVPERARGAGAGEVSYGVMAAAEAEGLPEGGAARRRRGIERMLR